VYDWDEVHSLARGKGVLTTGEVAKICRVAPRTVSKWFDTGQLRGYRIPGSKDRRIPVDQLVRFMRAHGMPLNGLDSGQTRVLIVDDQTDVSALLTRALADEARYDVRSAMCAFEAGIIADEFHPHVILISADIPGVSLRDVVRTIRATPDLGATRLIAVTAAGREGQQQALSQLGFDAVLSKPFDVSQVVRAIEGVLAVTN
jgi:two-component system, OmpR family, response regulator RpaA